MAPLSPAGDARRVPLVDGVRRDMVVADRAGRPPWNRCRPPAYPHGRNRSGGDCEACPGDGDDAMAALPPVACSPRRRASRSAPRPSRIRAALTALGQAAGAVHMDLIGGNGVGEALQGRSCLSSRCGVLGASSGSAARSRWERRGLRGAGTAGVRVGRFGAHAGSVSRGELGDGSEGESRGPRFGGVRPGAGRGPIDFRRNRSGRGVPLDEPAWASKRVR